jgi:hypothetical protein
VGAPSDDDGAEHNGAVYVIYLDGQDNIKFSNKISDVVSSFAPALTNSGASNF